MSKEKVRIKLKAYDHRILDNAATKIVETIKRSGGEISGPVPISVILCHYHTKCPNF